MSVAQKVPFAQYLDRHTAKRVQEFLQQTGKNLPCHVVAVDGAIVTVQFDVTSPFTLPQVTMPVLGSEYVRLPIQIGDLGFVISADAHLAGVSGLGSGVADLSQPGNLAALVFAPVGNKNWQVVDGDAVVIYGPNGVTLRDKENTVSIVITPADGIVITGALTINGKPYMAHEHSGVETGPGNTGGVVP